MSTYLAVILFGTAALTYGIRVLPFLSEGVKRLPDPVKNILKMMPVAALGALIFPGTFQALPEVPWAGLISIGAAALISWVLRGSLVLPVLASIGLTWLILIFQ